MMRSKYNATDAPFGWMPTTIQSVDRCFIGYDLSAFESHLSDYAKAVGLVLSLPTPTDVAPGPVGGGQSRHPIFENEKWNENKSPRVYKSIQELTNHINEVSFK
jgi:hypothetical protein